jgi:hypothetical protein
VDIINLDNNSVRNIEAPTHNTLQTIPFLMQIMKKINIELPLQDLTCILQKNCTEI